MNRLFTIIFLIAAIIVGGEMASAQTSKRRKATRTSQTTKSRPKKKAARSAADNVVAEFITFKLLKNGSIKDTSNFDKARGGDYADVNGAYLVSIETIDSRPDFYILYGSNAYSFLPMLSDEWADFINY